MRSLKLINAHLRVFSCLGRKKSLMHCPKKGKGCSKIIYSSPLKHQNQNFREINYLLRMHDSDS